VISIVVVALVNLGTIAIRNITFSRDKTLATRLVQEAIEWTRSQRDMSWTTFATRTGTWCMPTLAWSLHRSCTSTETIAGTVFTRTIVLTQINPSSIRIRASVQWLDSGGTKDVSVENILTNWK
jgi:hypothetical protein